MWCKYSQENDSKKITENPKKQAVPRNANSNDKQKKKTKNQTHLAIREEARNINNWTKFFREQVWLVNPNLCLSTFNSYKVWFFSLLSLLSDRRKKNFPTSCITQKKYSSKKLNIGCKNEKGQMEGPNYNKWTAIPAPSLYSSVCHYSFQTPYFFICPNTTNL